MKRITALLMALCLVLGLCACSSIATPTVKVEDLAGRWQNAYTIDEDEAEDVLEYFGFSEEERAVIDHDVFQVAQIFTVNTDKTYSFAIDGERSRSLVRQSFQNAVAQVYEHLGELTDTYGEDTADEMTSLEDFKEFTAYVYDFESFDEYLDAAVEGFLYEYFDMTEPLLLESGTFSIEGSDFLMIVDGETEAERLGFELSGNALLLTYEDGEELYSRIAE